MNHPTPPQPNPAMRPRRAIVGARRGKPDPAKAAIEALEIAEIELTGANTPNKWRAINKIGVALQLLNGH